ncbi:MFS transporter [Niabella hibiscisoli]|uniref:MFS transporter n=1 Tax=Niabella hibiscisoli TaxID=1825928 RepID=UPI0021D44AA3|nr:MFS transporter [Niabella hibiscisoli]
MASVLSPMYIAETAPSQMRGRMVAINQLTIVIGILVTNLVNYSLRNEGDDAWRWMMGLGAVPSALFLIGVIFLPESPHWLVKAGADEKATENLQRIGGLDMPRIALQPSKDLCRGRAQKQTTKTFLAKRCGLL